MAIGVATGQAEAEAKRTAGAERHRMMELIELAETALAEEQVKGAYCHTFGTLFHANAGVPSDCQLVWVAEKRAAGGLAG